MEVRDAVEADAEALAAIADAPADVMRNLVHDRTVCVAESAGESRSNGESGRTGDGNADLLGFVSFDVQDGTVHVTQFGGTAGACERLLAEPVRFAELEGMNVELLVAAEDGDLRTAAENAGFRENGSGPIFDGRPTVRYRLTTA